MKRLLHLFTPLQTLLLGFILLALLGAGLLMLPIANQDGQWQAPLDALFMTTSAVSTTGLGVVATAVQYTLFGQLVLLGLIQIGGLGYMTLLTFIVRLLGQQLTLRGGNLLESSLAVPSPGEMHSFILRVVSFTLLFEGIGALLLTLFWLREFPLAKAAYLGMFHSISAFCTAGFALFSDGFVAYRDSGSFNLIIAFISLSGAIGFIILSEAYVGIGRLLRRQSHRLSVHSKLAHVVLIALIVVATAVIWLVESDLGTTPFWPASFQAITAASTTGFNTVDVADLSDTSQLMLIILMYIGAPAGGTGGGIKATTFAVILLFLWAFMQGHEDINIYHRRLPRPTVVKALGIGIAAFAWLIPLCVVLSATESGPFLPVLFEAVSALGTVGMSMGITPDLSTAGKLLIIVTMIIGRVGPLTLALSLMRDQRPAAYRYPTEEVFVG